MKRLAAQLVGVRLTACPTRDNRELEAAGALEAYYGSLHARTLFYPLDVRLGSSYDSTAAFKDELPMQKPCPLPQAYFVAYKSFMPNPQCDLQDPLQAQLPLVQVHRSEGIQGAETEGMDR